MNRPKTPKHHQILHSCDYIERHESPFNYDGSRGDNSCTVKIKDHAQRINKEKVNLNFDIGWRTSEEDTIDHDSKTHYKAPYRIPLDL